RPILGEMTDILSPNLPDLAKKPLSEN
ncbi:MAG: hypothetical protein ACI97P_001855, partial [Arcticibacterium sp.]